MYPSNIKFISLLLALSFLIFDFAFAAQDNARQQELKNKIENLRNQIQKYREDISAKGEQEETLQNEITSLEKIIEKYELQMQETGLFIQNLDFEIEKKQSQIDAMQTEAVSKKRELTGLMQELYERGQVSSVDLIVGAKSVSDYFFQSDSIESFEVKTKEIHDQFVVLRDGFRKEQENLLNKKEEQMNLRAIQRDQQRVLDNQKTTKDSLLKRTRSEKEELSTLMAKSREELNALQSLGEPINVEEAIKAAKYASGLTSVAPEFLLGVLRVESGLGTNVGGGRYKTDMNPSQWDTFKKICRELDRDPDKTPVSRRVCYDKDAKDGCGGWGGAMGPAQMMPSTWMGYKDRVAKLTGIKPADPWNIKDSLVAMGLKLSAVEGVTEGSRKAWAKAAAMYLAGGNWENYSWYSDRVLTYADGYKKIINSKF
jgi:membrane-bound lytic murein transglycosylase B